MSVDGLGRVVMVIPTYNESENLEWIVGRLREAQPGVDVMVVDDNSPDGTGEIADRMAAQDPAVSVVHRTEKAGLGAAYLNGFAVALEAGYDVIGEMDADGSHQPEQLHRLLDALHTADLVIGSRYVPGGSVVNWPLQRLALSRGGNLYVRLLLGIKVKDATAGFRVFRRTTLEAIDLASVLSTGYVFQTDLAYRTVTGGMRVTEVPIEFIERVRGDSKMSGQVASESLKLITRWGLSERRRAAPQASGTAMTHPTAPRTPARRRRWVRPVLVLAFVVVPLVEIWAILQVGQLVGPWWTIALLILDSMVGAWLIKREGGRAWKALRDALAGRPDAGQGDRRRRADPHRRHPDAEPRVRARPRRAPAAPARHPTCRAADPHHVRGAPPRRRTRFGAGLGRAVRSVARPDREMADAPEPGPRARSSGATWSTEPDPGRGPGSARSSAHPLLAVRPVQVRGTDLSAAQQLEALLEDVLELLLRAALQEHVPVRTSGLLDLGLGQDARRAECLRPTTGTLPDRRDVGLDRHRHLELVSLLAQVADLLTSCELDSALVLKALAT